VYDRQQRAPIKPLSSQTVTTNLISCWHLHFPHTPTPLYSHGTHTTAQAVTAFKAAVQAGDINFYASAFCTVFEYADDSLMEWVSDFVHTVGDMAGQKHMSTVASQRARCTVAFSPTPLFARLEGVTKKKMFVSYLLKQMSRCCTENLIQVHDTNIQHRHVSPFLGVIFGSCFFWQLV
jgi:hypothetical protein